MYGVKNANNSVDEGRPRGTDSEARISNLYVATFEDEYGGGDTIGFEAIFPLGKHRNKIPPPFLWRCPMWTQRLCPSTFALSNGPYGGGAGSHARVYQSRRVLVRNTDRREFSPMADMRGCCPAHLAKLTGVLLGNFGLALGHPGNFKYPKHLWAAAVCCVTFMYHSLSVVCSPRQ